MIIRSTWRNISRTKSFSSHVAITMGTNLLMAFIALLTGTLAARILGPEGRGQLAAIQIWPIFFAGIALWGLPEAVVYFTAKNPRNAEQYMTSAMVLALILSAPILGLAYILMPVLLSAQDTQMIFFARWYLLLIFPNIILTMQGTPFRGATNLWVWNLLRPMPNLAWLTVLLVALVVGISSPQWLAFSYLLGLSLLILPRHYVLKRQTKSPLWSPRKKHWGPMLGYGFPLVLSSIPWTLNLRLDQMLMVAMLPAKTVGYYVIAVAWSTMASPLISAIGMVLFPHTASTQKIEDRNAKLKRGIQATIVIGVGLGLFALLLTPLAIPLLFGIDYLPSVPAACILVIAGAFFGLKNVLQEGIRGLGMTKLILWGESGGLIISVVILFLTIPVWGIMGAAFTSLLVYMVTAVFYLNNIARITNCKISVLVLPNKQDLAKLKMFLLSIPSLFAGAFDKND